MTNRLAVALACVAAVSLGGNAFAQKTRQSLPSDNTIAVTEDTTVKLNGESELYKETEASSPLDRKVSIRVSNVPISAFLNSITTQAKINFIMSEEFANKKVTASLTRVTVREALDTLLRVQGLAYQRIGKSDSYVVTKRSNDAPDTITKIYTLSYISLQGVGSAQSELNSIMPQDVSSSSSSSSSGDSTGLNLGGSSSGSGSDSYSGGAEITTIVKSMLSPVGKIAVDPRTNKLIITDVAEVFPQVENILAELDIKPPQILIEAQIVEVSKTSGLSLGFEYGGSDGAMVSMTGPKRKTCKVRPTRFLSAEVVVIPSPELLPDWLIVWPTVASVEVVMVAVLLFKVTTFGLPKYLASPRVSKLFRTMLKAEKSNTPPSSSPESLEDVEEPEPELEPEPEEPLFNWSLLGKI